MKSCLVGFFCALVSASSAQTYFNAWLTSCTHLIGPTGNVKTLQLALAQSRGQVAGSPAFAWDMWVDVGDWTASQHPPTHEDGEHLSSFLNTSFGAQRGLFFTVAGNHDGEAKGWQPGEFALKYINPLGAAEFAATSGFSAAQRPQGEQFRQLLSYPGTRWDRYLVRSGNIIWIMLGDRNEYDTLAEARGDKSGQYQAGRGSAAGMPQGGYPSGAVTRDTFEWWRRVVEDPTFADDILITTHHLLPRDTTITTDDGDPGNYHGPSGSVGPNGLVGGQLYWLREYDESGREIRQFAQTRPFLDYLRDHPAAIAIWIGGHTHVKTPDQQINGRGIQVRKYGVTFLSVGGMTSSHAAGDHQMSRLLTFENGSKEAIVTVYSHVQRKTRQGSWNPAVAGRVPLGKAFRSPTKTSNVPSPARGTTLALVPEAPADPIAPRYYWDLNGTRTYDFNNDTHVIGADGSPYGEFQNFTQPRYSNDSTFKGGRSLDFRGTNARVEFSAPYRPKMDWSAMTLSCWLRTSATTPQEAISYSSADGVGKFRLWFDGTAWIFDVAEGDVWRSARWKQTASSRNTRWRQFVAIVDAKSQRIQLYVENELRAEATWKGGKLKTAGPNDRFVIGASGDKYVPGGKRGWSRPFEGLIDEVMVFDSVMSATALRSIGSLR